MWLLMIAIIFQPPVPSRPVAAVDVVGMEPQLRLVREAAAQNGWQISCVGRSGEATVLRVEPRDQQAAVILSSYFAGRDIYVSSARYFYPGDDVPPSCDVEPPRVVVSGSSSTLAIAPRSALEPLQILARECGFARAFVRARRNDDLPARLPNEQSDWLTLDAGENAAARDAPLLCFIQLMNGRASEAGTPR